MDNEDKLDFIGNSYKNIGNDSEEIYRNNNNNSNNDRFSTGSNFLDSVDLLDINSLVLDDEENWLQKSVDVDSESERWMREEFETSDTQPYAFRKSLLNILNSLQDERRAQNIIPKYSSANLKWKSEIKFDSDLQQNLEHDLNAEPQSYLKLEHIESKPEVKTAKQSDQNQEHISRPRREKTFTIESDQKSPFSLDINSPSASADFSNFNYKTHDQSEDSNRPIKQSAENHQFSTMHNNSFASEDNIHASNIKLQKNAFSNHKPLSKLKALESIKSNNNCINISNDLAPASFCVADESNKSKLDDDSGSSTESLYYEASPNPLILMKTKPYGSFENCLESNGDRIGIATLIQFGDVQSAARKQEEFLKESFLDLSSRKSNRLTRSTDLQLEEPPPSFNNYTRSDISDACQRSLPNLNDQLSLAKRPSPSSSQEMLDLPTSFKKPLNPKGPHKFSAPRIIDPGNIAFVSNSQIIGSQMKAPLINHSYMNGDSHQFSSKLSTLPNKLNATFTKSNGLNYRPAPTSIKSSIPDKSLKTQPINSVDYSGQSKILNANNSKKKKVPTATLR